VGKPDFTHYSVQNIQVFLSAANTPFFGNPKSIKAISDGLLFSDVGYYQITKVDKKGNHLFSFGNHGRGPGEFQSISGFWPLENDYLVYDYNSFKFSIFDHSGKLIDEEVLDENPVNPNSKYSIPITLYAISPDSLLIPTGGRQNSLFAVANRNSGKVIYVGGVVNKNPEAFQNQEVLKAYSRGDISKPMLNLVMLSGNSSTIYSFQQTTGILEKYTHEGEQIWEIKLNIPAQRNLFDQIAEQNKGIEKGEIGRLFIYAKTMEVHKEGVAILLNVPEDQPLTIAWIPEDGGDIAVVKVEGIKADPNGFMEGFTVSPDGQFAYYLKRSKGIIYQFEWPL
jgi:hypothetical protein